MDLTSYKDGASCGRAWHLLSIIWPVLEIYSHLQKLVTTKLYAESVILKLGSHHKIC